MNIISVYDAELYDFLYHNNEKEKIMYNIFHNSIFDESRWISYQTSRSSIMLLELLPQLATEDQHILENELRRRKNLIISDRRKEKIDKLNSL